MSHLIGQTKKIKHCLNNTLNFSPVLKEIKNIQLYFKEDMKCY